MTSSFAPSDGQFKQISFVNGICNIKGKTNVNYITTSPSNMKIIIKKEII